MADDIWTKRRKKKRGLPHDLAIITGILLGFAAIWMMGSWAGLYGEKLSDFYRASYYSFFCLAFTVYNHRIRI